MRRILTFFLAMTLLAGMGLTAFAAQDASGSGSDHKGGADKTTEISVMANYAKPEQTRPTSYCVRVTWDNMSLQCNVTDGRTWNPDTHSYSGTRTARWTDNGNQVTIHVDNRSEADVKVTAAYQPVGGDVPALQMSFLGAGSEISQTVTIPAAEPGVNGNKGVSHTDNFTLSARSQPSKELANYLAENTLTDIKIGTVTITVEKVGSPAEP